MYTQYTISEPSYQPNFPMIDIEFDRFELNNDLSDSLHDADAATFYHDACDLEE